MVAPLDQRRAARDAPLEVLAEAVGSRIGAGWGRKPRRNGQHDNDGEETGHGFVYSTALRMRLAANLEHGCNSAQAGPDCGKAARSPFSYLKCLESFRPWPW